MKLYKYRRYSQNLIAGLSRSKLWLSEANKLNDIFDCRYDFGDPLTEVQLNELRVLEELREKRRNSVLGAIVPEKGASQEAIAKANLSTREMITHVLDRFGVSSFSEIPDSLLMWAHYAQDHTGVCIEYEIDVEREDLYRPFPVIYTTQYPVIDFYHFATDMPGACMRVLLSKSLEWSYEKEWRLFLMGTKNDEIDCPYKVTAVVMGARMKDIDKQTLQKVIQDKSVVFKQAVESKTAFKIQIK